MQPLLRKIKPAAGFSGLFHFGFRVALPVIVFILASSSIGVWLPLLVVLLSKWRVFAVRPRFWPANLRANSVDIMVGASVVFFMVGTESLGIRLLWAALYMLWLVAIKPASGILAISIQAGIAMVAGLMALFYAWPAAPLYGLVLLAGLICYLAARHFFDSFNEPYARLLSYLWGYFGAAMTWVLGHMLVVYPQPDGVIAQPTIMLTAIGFSLAAVYYLEHFDRLSTGVRRELLFLSGAIVVILLVSLVYESSHIIIQ